MNVEAFWSEFEVGARKKFSESCEVFRHASSYAGLRERAGSRYSRALLRQLLFLFRFDFLSLHVQAGSVLVKPGDRSSKNTCQKLR